MFPRKLMCVCATAIFAFLCSCSKQQEQPTAEAPRPVEAVTPVGPAFGTLSVEPNSGNGREQVFRLRLARAAGAPPPATMGLLINKGAAGNDACYLFAETATGRLLLVQDTGSGSKELGNAGSVANKQCELLKDQSNVETTPEAVTASFHVRFRPAFKGPRDLYGIAQDGNGQTAGLQPVGQQWIVP